MSISTSGEQRRPSVVAGKKAVAGGKPADPDSAESSSAESSPDSSATESSATESSVESSATESSAESSAESSKPTSKAARAKSAKSAGKTAGTRATGTKAAGPKAAGTKAAGTKAAGTKAAGTKAAETKAAETKAAETKAAGTKPAETKAAGAKAAGTKPAGAKAPGAKTGGKPAGPRRPITPVKVSQGRSWGPIALFTAVGVLAAGIIGWGAWAVYQNGRSWEDRASGINGLVDYRKKDPGMLTQNHKAGTLQYKTSPPVGGDHNPTWERCQGDVYDAQIPNENAVHSMEHGAVWITYRPDLAKDQVDKLAGKVRGNDYLLMSPYPGLDKPISLQAWGYQLKVDSANDGRIDDFIKALRQNATKEPGAVCSAGNYTTGTGTTPRDLTDQTDQSGGTGS